VKTLGPYKLLRKIGTGATAEVFLAQGPNRAHARLLALKVMLPHLAEDAGARHGFLREARVGALLLHPNIVQVYEVGDIEGRAFLAMELIRGRSVSVLEKQLDAARARLPFEEACAIVHQAALGLHHAHGLCGPTGRPLGLVHRDVSPQNLAVTEEGVVKVLDFGLAKVTQQGGPHTGRLRGKLAYMAPEQLRSEPLDRRADVFALGAVLWELICGQRLHPGANEAEILNHALHRPQRHPSDDRSGLPPGLVEVMLAAVERDRDQRISTAEELAEALSPHMSEDMHRVLSARLAKHFEPFAVPPPSETLELPGVDASTLGEEIEKTKVGPPPAMALAHQGRRQRAVAASLFALGLLAFAVPLVLGWRHHTELERARAPGTLIIKVAEPALILERGKELGTTLVPLTLERGDHRLVIQTVDRKRSVTLEVTIKPGEQLEREVSFPAR
jgi:serine/threonine protein kinase